MMTQKKMSPEDKRVALDALKLHDAYIAAFSGEGGALILADLEQRGFVNSLSFSTEPGRTEFNEGRRSLVLHVRHMISTKARDTLAAALRPENPEGENT